MIVAEYVFYGMGFLFVLLESETIKSPKECGDRLLGMRTRGYGDYTNYEKKIAVIHTLYAVWVFIGIFSSQWLAFFALSALSLVPKKTVRVRLADAIVSLLIILFIIINKFHFRIDMMANILNQ